MSNEEDGWAGPNQGWNMLNQLNAGVRAMMIDLYVWDNERKNLKAPGCVMVHALLAVNVCLMP